MAKVTLPTNFKDDILDKKMGGRRRYKMTTNSDGTVTLEDVTTYTQVGGEFKASNINDTNKAINAAADKNKILTTLDDVKACTQSGYMVDCLVVKAMLEG